MANGTTATAPTRAHTTRSRAKTAVASSAREREQFLSKPVTQYDFLVSKIETGNTTLEVKLRAGIKAVDSKIDVVDAKVDAVDMKIDAVRNELKADIKSLDKNLNTRIDATNARIDGLEENMNVRFDAVNTRIDDLRDSINKGFTRMGIGIGVAALLLAAVQIFIKIG